MGNLLMRGRRSVGPSVVRGVVCVAWVRTTDVCTVVAILLGSDDFTLTKQESVWGDGSLY